MKPLFYCLLFFFCKISTAQQKNAARFANLIDTTDLRNHLYVIASAEMEGRETATEGQRKAAAYIEQHFRKIGLSGGVNGTYQQRFPVYRDSTINASLSLNRQILRPGSDFAFSNNSEKNVSVKGTEVVFVGYGISDSTRNDYADVDVMNKVVLVLPGAPTVKVKKKKRPGSSPDVFTLQEAAKKNGAAAILIVDNRFPRPLQPALGSMYLNKPAEDSMPTMIFVSDSSARLIIGNALDSARNLKEGVPAAKVYTCDVAIDFQQITQHLYSTNVIGVLEGSDKKDEAVVITAHYDHMGKTDSAIFYGADDDGSGTVTILELGEAFAAAAAAGTPPKRTIILMAVSGEEKGLWGSAYYSANPVFPMEKTSANINIDMIGRVEAGRKGDSLNYVYVVGDNRLSSDLRPISETVNKTDFNFILDYKFNDPDDPQRIYYRSDHYNFAKHGVPALFYFNGLHNDYHRPSDTPDKINYSLLARRAQLIFHTAWEIANRNEMLKRDLP